MKSVFLKSVNDNTGMCYCTGDGLAAGDYRKGDLIVYEIKNVPDNTPVNEVCRIFNATINVCGNIFDFANIGYGKIAKGETV